MNKISGVYKITNNITGDFYIGSSKDIKHRWANHNSSSTWKQCPNSIMYQDMTKYGLSNFKFEIIEETENLKEREQYWINILKPSYNDRRATGLDTERHRKYYKVHKGECLARHKEWYKMHSDYMKECHNKCCFYEGETLTLNALSQRFQKQGILHAWLEAKKYLIEENK